MTALFTSTAADYSSNGGSTSFTIGQASPTISKPKSSRKSAIHGDPITLQ